MIQVVKANNYFVYFIFLSIITGCSSTGGESVRIYNANEVYDPGKIYAVIENPAGTSEVMTFDFESNDLVSNGDTIRFLPHPTHFGFILREHAKEDELTRTDHLSCMVISTPLLRGEMREVTPIGVISIEEPPEKEQNLLICVPKETEIQSVKIKDFVELMTRYDGIRFQIQHWFANYKGVNRVRIKGWEDEHYAARLLNQSSETGIQENE